MNKEELQNIAFSIINEVGQAKSQALISFDKYQAGEMSKQDALKEIEQQLINVSKAGEHHLSVIQAEAAGGDIPFSVIFLHAEDLYISTTSQIEILIRMLRG